MFNEKLSFYFFSSTLGAGALFLLKKFLLVLISPEPPPTSEHEPIKIFYNGCSSPNVTVEQTSPYNKILIMS
jgi:hypothetical protein